MYMFCVLGDLFPEKKLNKSTILEPYTYFSYKSCKVGIIAGKYCG